MFEFVCFYAVQKQLVDARIKKSFGSKIERIMRFPPIKRAMDEMEWALATIDQLSAHNVFSPTTFYWNMHIGTAIQMNSSINLVHACTLDDDNDVQFIALLQTPFRWQRLQYYTIK